MKAGGAGRGPAQCSASVALGSLCPKSAASEAVPVFEKIHSCSKNTARRDVREQSASSSPSSPPPGVTITDMTGTEGVLCLVRVAGRLPCNPGCLRVTRRRPQRAAPWLVRPSALGPPSLWKAAGPSLRPHPAGAVGRPGRDVPPPGGLCPALPQGPAAHGGTAADPLGPGRRGEHRQVSVSAGPLGAGAGGGSRCPLTVVPAPPPSLAPGKLCIERRLSALLTGICA